MQLSTKGRYAVMAMVDLAAHEMTDGTSGLICLADIARRQQLSLAYLEQLFGKLRRANLVCSARGPGGGYRLARLSCQIAIADIVAAVDEQIKATRCEMGSGGCLLAAHSAEGHAPEGHAPDGRAAEAQAAEGSMRPGGEMCQTHDLWFELGRQIELFLRGITLADVVLGQVPGRAVTVPPAEAVRPKRHATSLLRHE
jgi:Rrf2 family iron-sulfur cluster assembly transcriptional regulator